MKLCIPITLPAGLDSSIAPELAEADHLLVFDRQTRSSTTLDLRLEGAQERILVDAVICAKASPSAAQALAKQGIEIYVSNAPTAAQAIREYEAGRLLRMAVASGDDACHGQGAEHRAASCCSGHAPGGCGGHGHAHEGAGASCCGRHHARPEYRRPRGDVQRFAVSSQNRKTVTEHAGKCRNFWIFDVRGKDVVGKRLIELGIDQSFNAARDGEPHALDGIDVLLSAGIGAGLQQRLRRRGIEALRTAETDPELAVAAYLASAAVPPSAERGAR